MSEKADVDSGWIQVNNTVVPYVRRHLVNGLPVQLVPLPVIQYGAGLLRGAFPQTLKATPTERFVLNGRCQKAGLNFSFDENIDLIPLYDVVSKYKKDLYVSFLPDDDPLGKAEFHVDIAGGNHIAKDPWSSSPPPKCLSDDQTIPAQSPTPTENDHEVLFVLDLSNKTKQSHHPEDAKVNSGMAASRRPIGTKDYPIDLTQKSPTDSEVSFCTKATSVLPAKKTSSVRQSPDTIPGPISILPVRVRDHLLPAIVKSGVHFVLVETIRKVYFADCSLTAFLFIVRRYVGRYLYDLQPDDVQAIVQFARNASCVRRCQKVISVRDADRMIPVIRSFLTRVRSRVRNKHGQQPKISSQQTTSASAQS